MASLTPSKNKKAEKRTDASAAVLPLRERETRAEGRHERSEVEGETPGAPLIAASPIPACPARVEPIRREGEPKGERKAPQAVLPFSEGEAPRASLVEGATRAPLIERPRYSCALGGALALVTALPEAIPIMHATSGCAGNFTWAQSGGGGLQVGGLCGGLTTPSSNVQNCPA